MPWVVLVTVFTAPFGVRPRPQYQVPNRTGSGAPDASAVPLVFRKQSRKGSATETAPPPSMPRNSERRRIVGICTKLMTCSPW